MIDYSKRNCRVLSFGVLDAVKIIRDELNIPTLVLYCDRKEERVYFDKAFMYRIEAFLEILG